MGNLTDNEIIKALECISTFDCEICVENKCSYHTGDEMCPCNDVKIVKDALDLINRYKAEAERLQTRVGELIRQHNNDIGKAKSEAIKEFAERLKKVYANHLMCSFNVINNEIDNVLNEMLPEPSKVEHDSLCETETYKAMKERF